MDKKQNGIRSFFFGKKKVVKHIKSPFSYKLTPEIPKDSIKQTIVAFIKHCDYENIFDEDIWKCIPRKSPKGKDIARHRLEKYKSLPLQGDDILGLWQFQSNCWFNSLLMCLFFSDKIRDIMNELRVKWISTTVSGNTHNAIYKTKLLNIFTYLMEIPHYNKDIINTIDSNMILTLLHKYDPLMFEHKGNRGGSGILYCKKVLSFLGFKEYMEIRLINLEKEGKIYVEINDEPIDKIDSDISHTDIVKYIISIIKEYPKIRLLAIYIDIKPYFVIPSKLEDMTLESIYVSNYKNTRNTDKHAIAGIVCSGIPYVYDGERAALNSTLKKYNWLSDDKRSFAMTYDPKKIMKYDFTKSNRVAFFVSTNNI
jgi:hypothetical protein